MCTPCDMPRSYTLNMSDPEGSRSHLKGEAVRLKTDEMRMRFLRTDLATCFTFADLAATRYKTGAREAAAQSVANAEKGYAAILRFMSDPKHGSRISDEERRELTAGLDRLRARLDELGRL